MASKVDSLFKVGDKVRLKKHPLVISTVARMGVWYDGTLDAVIFTDGSWAYIKDIELVPEESLKKTQIGGNHYSSMKIQPYEYILKNNIGFMEGGVIKYVSRWKNKGGIEDLKKARHMLDLLIESVKDGSFD